MVTIAQAKKVLRTVDAGLVSGLGEPVPGKMCVEAAVCYALGLPHGDNPETCVAQSVRQLKIRLNDAKWSSNAARTDGLRELALLQLGSLGMDERAFATRVVIMCVQTTLADLCKRRFPVLAASCRKITTLAEAKRVSHKVNSAAYSAAGADAYAAATAAAAAAYAADADAYAADVAAYAAAAAANAAAAAAAANAAAADAVLKKFANNVSKILIDMKVPGVRFLPLLKAKA